MLSLVLIALLVGERSTRVSLAEACHWADAVKALLESVLSVVLRIRLRVVVLKD